MESHFHRIHMQAYIIVSLNVVLVGVYYCNTKQGTTLLNSHSSPVTLAKDKLFCY
jgi:hypothetical protein